MTADAFVATERTRVRRLPHRGSFDRQLAYSILDEGLICHIAFAVAEQPYAIPTIHARIDDRLYVHGAPASRLLKTIGRGAPVCVTVTLVDGLVFARSAFHHSMNYRSVVVLGAGEEVRDSGEKLAALSALTERLSPGRWSDTRPPTDKELRSTSVLRLPICEASVKTRTGPPVDDEQDYGLPHWAGVVPVRVVFGEPEDDARLADGTPRPAYLAASPL